MPTRPHLILYDHQLDPLWHDYLRRAHPAENTWTIDLSLHRPGFDWPHPCNVVGWLRWLKTRHIQTIHCYQPGRSAWAVLAAAYAMGVETIFHLTGFPGPGVLTLGRICRRGHIRFVCAGHFITRPLDRCQLSPGQITVEVPSVVPAVVAEGERQRLRSQIAPVGPVLLALARPQNFPAIKLTLRTAAMLKHALGDLTLIVAGPLNLTDRNRLLRWQSMWHAQGLLYLDNNQHPWDVLTAVSDVVLLTEKHLSESLRLLHASRSGRPIVTLDGDAREFLQTVDHVHIVHPATSRQLSITLLPLLEASPS